MSFDVLVVPEDPTYNGYLLKPLIERVLEEAGKPRAKVTVLTSPKVGGIEDAKRKIKDEILDRYRFMSLIFFICDADGKDRSQEFRALEDAALSVPVSLMCCAPVQELEAWLLAGLHNKWSPDWTWEEIRADISVKEHYFAPFFATYGNTANPGSSRKELMQEALENYAGIKGRCPELADLERRVREHIASLR